MANRLRVGIIGLGRRWQRYRPILAGLRDHLEIRAVCDHVERHASHTAKQLDCAAAAGPVDLLDRDDVEAVLLLDSQWFGLWPIEWACQVGKPVFCALTPAHDDPHAEVIRETIHQKQLPLVMAVPLLRAPILDHLRKVLEESLGPARLARVDRRVSAVGACSLQMPTALPLLTACSFLMGGSPESVWACPTESSAFTCIVLTFAGARAAQLSLWATPDSSHCRLEAITEKGSAAAVLPRSMVWTNAEGQHTLRLPASSLRRRALEHFLRVVRGEEPVGSDFEQSYQALRLLRAARRSLGEGRRVAVI
jgi:predicted dehydrogenase